jgi:elongation factor 1-alpha
VYKITGVGTVPVGRVESGILRPGMEITFSPGNIRTKCENLEIGGSQYRLEAIPGDNQGFSVKYIRVTDIRRGMVVGDSNSDPPRETVSFIAHIYVSLDKGETLKVGSCSVLKIHTAQVDCRIERLINKLDRRTGKIIQENPEILKNGEIATVLIVPLSPVCVEANCDYPGLGKFILRDLNKIFAIGSVKTVEKKAEGNKKDNNKKD